MSRPLTCCLLLLCVACGRKAEAPEKRQVEPAGAAEASSLPAAQAPTKATAPTKERVPRPGSQHPQLRLLEGTLQRQADSVLFRDRAPVGDWLELTSDRARLVSDDGTVVFELSRGARFRVGQVAPMQVYLASGMLLASVSPRGGAALPTVRVPLSTVTATIPATGSLLVRSVDGGGKSWIAVVGGGAEIFDDGTESPELRLRPALGARVVSAEGLASPVASAGPFETENQAKAAADAWARAQAVNAQAAPTQAAPARKEPAAEADPRSRLADAVKELLPQGAALQARVDALLHGERPTTTEARAQVRRDAVALASEQAAYQRELLFLWERAVSSTAGDLDESSLLPFRRRVIRQLQQ